MLCHDGGTCDVANCCADSNGAEACGVIVVLVKSHEVIGCEDRLNGGREMGVDEQVDDLAEGLQVGEREGAGGLSACMQGISSEEIGAVTIGASGCALA